MVNVGRRDIECPQRRSGGRAQQMQRVAEKGSSEQQVPTGLTVSDLCKIQISRKYCRQAANADRRKTSSRALRVCGVTPEVDADPSGLFLTIWNGMPTTRNQASLPRGCSSSCGIPGAQPQYAAAFLAELVAYKLLQPASADVPRERPSRADRGQARPMRLWFKSQMSTIDLLDGGTRVSRVEADKSIFRTRPPLAARRLLSDNRWTTPAEGCRHLCLVESGGVILDDLNDARLRNSRRWDGKVWSMSAWRNLPSTT